MPYRVIFITGNYSHNMALMSADLHGLQIFLLSDLPFRRLYLVYQQQRSCLVLF
jgi:hypothetical protein